MIENVKEESDEEFINRIGYKKQPNDPFNPHIDKRFTPVNHCGNCSYLEGTNMIPICKKHNLQMSGSYYGLGRLISILDYGICNSYNKADEKYKYPIESDEEFSDRIGYRWGSSNNNCPNCIYGHHLYNRIYSNQYHCDYHNLTHFNNDSICNSYCSKYPPKLLKTEAEKKSPIKRLLGIIFNIILFPAASTCMFTYLTVIAIFIAMCGVNSYSGEILSVVWKWCKKISIILTPILIIEFIYFFASGIL